MYYNLIVKARSYFMMLYRFCRWCLPTAEEGPALCLCLKQRIRVCILISLGSSLLGLSNGDTRQSRLLRFLCYSSHKPIPPVCIDDKLVYEGCHSRVMSRQESRLLFRVYSGESQSHDRCFPKPHHSVFVISSSVVLLASFWLVLSSLTTRSSRFSSQEVWVMFYEMVWDDDHVKVVIAS